MQGPAPWNPLHILEDITRQVAHGLTADDCTRMNWDYWCASARVHAAPLARHVYCQKCNAYHARRELEVDFEWKSTPCTMWSSSQNDRLREQSPVNMVWLCSSHKNMVEKTAAVASECVVKQPAWFVQKDYPNRPMFRVERGPQDIGFSHCSRTRALSFMPDTDHKCTLHHDPAKLFDEVAKFLQVQDMMKICNITNAAVLEFLTEADYIHRKRFNNEPLPQWAVQESVVHGLDAMDFSFMLWEREVNSLEDYCYKYHIVSDGHDPLLDPNLCVFLGDNASTHASWSYNTHAIPTCRTNTGFMWLPSKKRWLTSRQILSCNGIPQSLKQLACLKLPPEWAQHLEFGNHSTRRHFAGNCVHAAVAGVFVGCCLASIELNQ